jgi:hypothetical protein
MDFLKEPADTRINGTPARGLIAFCKIDRGRDTGARKACVVFGNRCRVAGRGRD